MLVIVDADDNDDNSTNVDVDIDVVGVGVGVGDNVVEVGGEENFCGQVGKENAKAASFECEENKVKMVL